ncbi:MAG: glycosyltransferase family 2 protein [Trueperaceae bacterium]|nr:glycosyltransferase family 2 protein [Trueperaceae bacterium]
MLLALQTFILLYFITLNLSFALSLYIAAKELGIILRSNEDINLKSLLERDFYKPISLLVPAYNEEATIVASLNSLLNLHYPEYEVVVVNDGSKDNTAEVVKAYYDLYPAVIYTRKLIETKPIRAIYRSRKYPNLLFIDKANGGKADALNAALLHSQYPIFCAMDADSLLDSQALLRSARQFTEDDTLIATGGTIRSLNNAETSYGQILKLKAPVKWIERFQVVEYIRAFLAGRTTLSNLGMLLIISGAFGLFKRSVVLEVGGYRTDTVGEDMELVVRLHRHMREKKRPYRISYTMDPICWTQVPDDWRVLRKQRNRWHRGLLETLWNHRQMMLNPRYGRIGMLAMPYFWLFEALSPLIEIGGYALLMVLIMLGKINFVFASMFMVLAVLSGILISMSAFGIEAFMRNRYPTSKDRLLLLLASVLENFGYRQLIAWERLVASFQVFKKKGQWGEMKRQAIKT